MKKVIAISTALAMFAAATPALAFFNWFDNEPEQPVTEIDIDVKNDDTTVTNNVTTQSSTGGNESEGGKAKSKAYGNGADSWAGGGNGGSITTGDAYADSLVSNNVNSTSIRKSKMYL